MSESIPEVVVGSGGNEEIVLDGLLGLERVSRRRWIDESCPHQVHEV